MSTKIRNGQGEAPMKALQTSGLEAKSVRNVAEHSEVVLPREQKENQESTVLWEQCLYQERLISSNQHSTVESLFKMRTENSPLDLVMSGHRWPWLSSFGRVVGKKPNWSVFTFNFHFSLSRIGEGNGNPLQWSCLKNPRDEGAWWAAVYRVAQSRTRQKRLGSSSSKRK